MGQSDIYEFLKNNPGKEFTSMDLQPIFQVSNVSKTLSSLLRWYEDVIEVRVVQNTRYVKFVGEKNAQ